MAILTTAAVIGLGTKLIQSGIFERKEPTPEEQKEKGRVWYKMLQDFVVNSLTPQQLATAWADQLPFAQKATKKRFMANEIVGKTDSQIIDNLVGKINDELVKGGFSSITKEAILSGMGAGDTTAESPAALGVVDAGARPDFVATDLSVLNDQNESRMFFLVGGLLLLTVGVITFLFFGTKKRRR